MAMKGTRTLKLLCQHTTWMDGFILTLCHWGRYPEGALNTWPQALSAGVCSHHVVILDYLNPSSPAADRSLSTSYLAGCQCRSMHAHLRSDVLGCCGC